MPHEQHEQYELLNVQLVIKDSTGRIRDNLNHVLKLINVPGAWKIKNSEPNAPDVPARGKSVDAAVISWFYWNYSGDLSQNQVCIEALQATIDRMPSEQVGRLAATICKELKLFE